MAKNSWPAATQRRRKPKASVTAAPRVTATGEQYQLKAITRALEVLECFGDEQTSLNLKEVAQRVNSPESSLFRILLTLKSQGYLRPALIVPGSSCGHSPAGVHATSAPTPSPA